MQRLSPHPGEPLCGVVRAAPAGPSVPAAAQAGHTDQSCELCERDKHPGAAGAVKRTGTLSHITQIRKDQAKSKVTNLSRN